MTAAIATDEERTFVRRLEAGLAAGRRPAAEVMNFGVASASTGAELVTWRGAVAEYRPDLVLLAFFTGNDLADNSSRLTRAPRPYFDVDDEGRLRQEGEPTRLPLSSGGSTATAGSTCGRRSPSAGCARRRRQASAGIEPGQRIFARGGGPAVEHAWRVTGALLRQLRDEVEASGARFGVVVIPCAEQVDDALWADLARRRARGPGWTSTAGRRRGASRRSSAATASRRWT